MPVTTVLLSGGMDSMACVHLAQAFRQNVRGLYIDYGQPSASREQAAVRQVSAYFGIECDVVRVGGLQPLVAANGFIMGRNMAFVLLALMNLREDTGSIVLGIHSGSAYSDCSPGFVTLAQQVADLYTGGGVRVEAPFVNRNKAQLAIYCLLNRLPRQFTYSCELGLDQPCGQCGSCKDLIALDGPD